MPSPANIHIAFSGFDSDYHRVLTDGFLRLQHDAATRRSHYFGDRHENIYITSAQLPELQPLIDASLIQARDVLGVSAERLRCGHWFNAMQPGHATSLHSHDDDDERLSGVYYIQVPSCSGQLTLHVGDQVTHVQPQPGMWVFFPADLPHAVSTHRGEGLRLSLGMNFGGP